MPADQPLVTIVTSSFNQARFLEQAMQSVMGQTYPRVEYVVTDAGSTDGSAEIIRKFSGRLSYWHSRPDGGPADGIAQGFQQAGGDILGWLNADDLLAGDAVEKAVAALGRHRDAAMVYGNRIVIGEDGGFLYCRPSLPFLAQTPYIATILPQETCFFRREAYSRSGGLDPGVRFAFDYDLFSRIASCSRVAYSGDIWGFFRKHGNSLTMQQTSTTGEQDIRRVQDRVWGRKCGAMEWTAAHLLVKAYAVAATPFFRLPPWPPCLPAFHKKNLFRRAYASLHETSRIKRWVRRLSGWK
jgi:glycosyltransferase involved in cell wall biosynthesis